MIGQLWYVMGRKNRRGYIHWEFQLVLQTPIKASLEDHFGEWSIMSGPHDQELKAEASLDKALDAATMLPYEKEVSV